MAGVHEAQPMAGRRQVMVGFEVFSQGRSFRDRCRVRGFLIALSGHEVENQSTLVAVLRSLRPPERLS